jgi:hypothetical protein
MAADSAAIAAVDVNCLRETLRGESSRMRESSVDTGSLTATRTSCYTESDARGHRQFYGRAARACAVTGGRCRVIVDKVVETAPT